MTLCAALASLLLFLLVWKAGEPLGGLLASQLLLIHPVMMEAAGRAMADIIASLFSIAAAFSAFAWFSYFSRSGPSRFVQGLPLSITTGFLLALACGAKMNSLVIVVLMGVLVAMIMGQKWVNHHRAEAIKAGAHGLIILAIALVTFILINPAIIHDLVSGLAASVLEQQHTLAIQMDTSDTHLSGLPAKLGAVVSMGFFHWILFLTMMAIIGSLVVLRGNETGVRFATCWWLVAFICVTLWIPLTWPRYVIPLFPPTAWLTGCFIATSMRWLRQFFWKQAHH